MRQQQQNELYCNPYKHIYDFKGPEDNILQSMINVLMFNEVMTCQQDLRWLALHLHKVYQEFYKCIIFLGYDECPCTQQPLSSSRDLRFKLHYKQQQSHVKPMKATHHHQSLHAHQTMALGMYTPKERRYRAKQPIHIKRI